MKRFCLIMLVALVMLNSGCPNRGRGLPVQYVEGVITMDGEPLEEAMVSFVPATDGSNIEAAAGRTDANGKYTLTSMNGDPNKGALVGEYKVLVTKIINIFPPGFNPSDPIPPPTKRITPLLYNDRSKTPFSASVVKGKNKFTFDLKSKP